MCGGVIRPELGVRLDRRFNGIRWEEYYYNRRTSTRARVSPGGEARVCGASTPCSHGRAGDTSGKDSLLYAIPEHPPATQSSQAFSSPRFTLPLSRPSVFSLARMKNRLTTSKVVNHALDPPVSRIRVPEWPSQRPRTPVEAIVWRRMVSGPGRAAKLGRTGAAEDGEVLEEEEAEARRARFSARRRVTCILTLTSSIGVLDPVKKDHGRDKHGSKEGRGRVSPRGEASTRHTRDKVEMR